MSQLDAYLGSGTTPRPPAPARLLWQFRHDPPSYTLDNVYEQANHYTDIVYLAIQTLSRVLSAATVQLVKLRPAKPRAIRKALASPGVQGAGDEKFVPILNHPLAKLLRRPNRKESFARFQTRAIIQRCLHGRLLIWGPRNRAGAPCELYVLPTALCQPVYPSATYPEGAWRVTQTNPGMIWAPIAGYLGSITELIDAREVYKWDSPHAVYPWLPYSPLTGTARQIDLAQQIDKAAWAMLQNAPAPSGVIDVPGASEAELSAMQERLTQKHAGPNNTGRILYLGGAEREGKSAASFTPITGLLKDAPLSAEREAMQEFVLAVFGVSATLCNLGTSDSYAKLYAEIQRVRLMTLDPYCSDMGDLLTHGPVADWFPAGHDVRAQVDLPKLTDPETVERRIGEGKEVFTVNERRGMAGLGPRPDGDVMSDTYAQVEMQAHAPQPDPMAPPVPGEQPQPGANGKPGGAAKPGQPSPNGKPQPAGPPSLPRPANPAGKGSLPPRMAKALTLAFVEEIVLNHVLAAIGIEDEDTTPILKAMGWDEDKHPRDRAGEFSAVDHAVGSARSGRLTDTHVNAARAEVGTHDRHQRRALAVRLGLPKNASRAIIADELHRQLIQSHEMNRKIPGAARSFGVATPSQLTEKLAAAAPRVAATAADAPGAGDHLGRVKAWASRKAAEHAERVAVKLGVSPGRAMAILERAIAELATYAAAHGGRASGTIRVGGKKVKLSIGGTAHRVIAGAMDRDRQSHPSNPGGGQVAAGGGSDSFKPPSDQHAILRKINMTAQQASLNDPMGHGAGVGTSADFASVPHEVLARFDAHGAGSLGNLAALLNGGIDPGREFYSSPLSEIGRSSGGYGLTVKGSSPFIVIGHPGQTLKAGGIGGVIVDGHHAAAIPEFQRAFPHIKFLAAKDAARLLPKVGDSGPPVKYKAMSELVGSTGGALVPSGDVAPRKRTRRRRGRMWVRRECLKALGELEG